MPLIPALLRGSPLISGRRVRLRELVLIVVLFGSFYGLVMGTFGGPGGARWGQPFYSALKVPMLMGVSFALTVPSFFVLNTLTGLRADFGRALRAVAAAQAGLVITLASLAPFTGLWYLSCVDYTTAVLFNGLMFAIATAAGQVLLRRFYRDLIALDPKHKTLLRAWTVVYSFIAIQMAWVLRPFVGGPGEATTFLRPTAWGNAYVVIGEMIWRWVRKI